MIDLDVVVSRFLYPPWVEGHLWRTRLVQRNAMFEGHLCVMGAMDNEDGRVRELDLHDILKDIKPESGLHIVDDAQAALQGTVQNGAAKLGPRGQVYHRHASYGLAIGDDLRLRNTAVVGEIM